ncbi:MAG: hypothetical protein RIR12_2432 [Bacteroidota bacterium]|jgi:hypothetical protein
MKATFLLFFLLLYVLGSFAQKKINYASQNYVGVMVGEVESTLQLHSINGVRVGNWFAGVGTGMDWYFKRSVPLFASINNIIFSKGRRSFFVAADAGLNFPWPSAKDMYSEFYYAESKSTKGLYWSGGAGFRLGVGKADNNLLLQFGYSFKQSGETITTILPCINPPCMVSQNTYDYRLKRLSFKLGWGF